MLAFLRQKYRNLSSDARFSEIFTGSVWALSGRVVSTAFALAFSVLVARFYGAEEVGIVAVINSFLMLVTLFTVLGTQTSILRLIPEHIAKYSHTSAFRVFRKTQWIVICASFATTLLFFFMADLLADKVFSKPHLSFYLALASVFIVFKSMALLNTQAVRGLRMVRFFAVMQFMPNAGNLLFLVVVGFLLWPSADVPVYAVMFGLAATAIAGWLAVEIVFKKRMGPDDLVSPMPAREIISISLPMLMTATMSFLIAETGILMLGMFRTEAEVGYYSIAVKLATLTTFILAAVNSMAGPKFSELFHTNRIDDLFYVARKSAKLVFYTTTPILLVLVVFGKPILELAFGAEFTSAYPAMVILVAGQFVNSISGSTALFMDMTGHQKRLRNIMALAALLNITANLILIPPFGINGAAISAATSFCFWNITILAFLKIKFVPIQGYNYLFLNKKAHFVVAIFLLL